MQEVLYKHVSTVVVSKFKTLQQAQVCTDIDYFIRSIHFYKRILIRRATMGSGKLTVSGLNKWFKLDTDKLAKTKRFMEDNISKALKKELDKILVEAASESWCPKEAMSGKTLYHSHMDDFFMFFLTIVVPLASYNAELATQQADLMLRTFSRQIIKQACSGKINQCGIINLYLDYVALAEFVATQKQQSQLLVIDTINLGLDQSLKITE